ncbi:MAG: hypothetical protein J1G01_01395 [Clostridiales bacterium]|nr:hypothetical protein [Clostridiales bacterium]
MKNKICYYNTKSHIFIIIVEMILVFLLCVAVIPYMIKGIYSLFESGYMPWFDKIPVSSTGSSANDGTTKMPDFLGGMIGVILGFVFDLLFIVRIRRIVRYKLLMTSLTGEFDRLWNDIDEKIRAEDRNEFKKQIFEFACTNNDTYTVLNEKVTLHVYPLRESLSDTIMKWAIGDIVSSVENESLFSNLPRSLLLFDLCKKYSVADCIHTINGAMTRFNSAHNAEQREQQLKTILGYIERFRICTNKKNYKEYKKYIKNLKTASKTNA